MGFSQVYIVPLSLHFLQEVSILLMFLRSSMQNHIIPFSLVQSSYGLAIPPHLSNMAQKILTKDDFSERLAKNGHSLEEM